MNIPTNINRLLKLTGVVVSLFVFLSCHDETPEQLADEWCELNYLYMQPDANKDEVYDKLYNLEIKIKDKYKNNYEALKKIEQLTFNCDTIDE
jgi:hypothetical protein